MDVNSCESVTMKISRLFNEGVKMKSDKRTEHIWRPEFDETLDSLKDLIEMMEYDSSVLDETIIESNFNDLTISKYNSFKSYLTSKSLDASRYFNHSNEKVKMNRTTSKINKCKKCNFATFIEGDKIICQNPNCGFIEEIKNNKQRTTNDKMKHLKDKLKMIAGLKDPPKKIINLLPYIKIWLTNLNYLFDWLKYKETTIISKTSLNLDKWLMDFTRIYRPKDETNKWKLIIEDKEQYAWSYNEFKLIIIEFYNMLTECERLNKMEFIGNNLDSKTEEEIYEIFKDYKISHENIPTPTEKFIYNEEVYDVGNFINVLRLMNIDSDIKIKIESLFGTQIKMPGLMFNFYLNSKMKPERHVFTESYSYIIHKTFNISFDDVPLTLDVIDQMALINEDFDNFVREEMSKSRKSRKSETHKNNSKLYVCKLKCILELPYFNKFSNIYKYFPVKSEETFGTIEDLWRRYTSLEPFRSQIKQYDKTD